MLQTSLTNLLLSNLAKGSLKRALAEYGINILSEGLEEGTQEILGPILENTVKYGIDYNDDFQEWKNIMNNMSLEEWQESKFIEWKAENLYTEIKYQICYEVITYEKNSEISCVHSGIFLLRIQWLPSGTGGR